MAENTLLKIMAAILKHQVKKIVGDETLEVISEEIADIGGDKIEVWLREKSTRDELEKAASSAREDFRNKIHDEVIEQWLVMLPIHNLPAVLSAIEELPVSPDESKLESALRESISMNWNHLSTEQVDYVVQTFLSCLRRAILPIEKQTLMVIGRSVLRTEDKVDLLVRWFEEFIIREQPGEIKQPDLETIDYWDLKHPYAMPPGFTGRFDERKMLTEWLNNDNGTRLLIIRALGGFGKTALAWQWLIHDVDKNKWAKVIWWSFYEGDSSFEHFIEEILHYMDAKVPQGQRNQVDELLKIFQSQRILIVMDGFERTMRAFNSMDAAYQGDEEERKEDSKRDCVNIYAELFLKSICALPNMKSKVLITTRLTPRAVETRGQLLQGCQEEELKAMSKSDAVTFFRTQGIYGTHTEIESICEPYGYHPLSLRILSGLIVYDRDKPYDITAAERLDITNDIIANKNHVLKVAYDTLLPDQQKLLSTIACFRSPITFDALKSIVGRNKEYRRKEDSIRVSKTTDSDLSSREFAVFDENLKILEDRGLLHWDRKSNKYDLHPIVRRYAYERLTANDRSETHSRLRDYFAAIPLSDRPKTISELTPIIELYHHCVHACQYMEAFSILKYRLNDPLYKNGGEYILFIELVEALLSSGLDILSDQDQHAISWLLNKLALCYNRTGRSIDAEVAFRKNISIREKMGYLPGVAIGLGNLSEVLVRIGRLKEATEVLERKIAITKQIGDQSKEMAGRQDYGLVMAYRGEFKESEKQLKYTFDWFLQNSKPRDESVSWTFDTILKTLQGKTNEALESAKHAYELAFIEKRNRDVVRVLWLLGLTNYLFGNFSDATSCLENGLAECRRINLLELEPNILLAWASLHYDQKNYDVALSFAQEALAITERCGYVLQGAEVNLFMAKFLIEQNMDRVKAKEYAETAQKLASCDDPQYIYTVAFQKAKHLLDQLEHL